MIMIWQFSKRLKLSICESLLKGERSKTSEAQLLLEFTEERDLEAFGII